MSLQYAVEAGAKAFEFIRPDTLMDKGAQCDIVFSRSRFCAAVRAVFNSFTMGAETSRRLYEHIFKGSLDTPVDDSDTTVIRALTPSEQAAAATAAATVEAAPAAATTSATPAAEPEGAAGSANPSSTADSKSSASETSAAAAVATAPVTAITSEVQRQIAKVWRSFHAKFVSEAIGSYPREVLLAVVHDFLRNGIPPEVIVRMQAVAKQNAELTRQRYARRLAAHVSLNLIPVLCCRGGQSQLAPQFSL